MKATYLRVERLSAGINRQIILARELGWNAETLIDIERGRIGIDESTERQIRDAIRKLSTREVMTA